MIFFCNSMQCFAAVSHPLKSFKSRLKLAEEEEGGHLLDNAQFASWRKGAGGALSVAAGLKVAAINQRHNNI